MYVSINLILGYCSRLLNVFWNTLFHSLSPRAILTLNFYYITCYPQFPFLHSVALKNIATSFLHLVSSFSEGIWFWASFTYLFYFDKLILISWEVLIQIHFAMQLLSILNSFILAMAGSSNLNYPTWFTRLLVFSDKHFS